MAIKKRFICCCLLLLALLLCASAGAEPLTFGPVTVDSEAEYVDFGNLYIDQWGPFYDFLASLPNLKKVDLFGTQVRWDRIQQLHEKFPDVDFGLSMRLQDHVVRTDATAFSTLHTDRSEIHFVRDLSLVRYCKNLYALDLGHNKLSDLSFLYDLPELRVLIIAIDYVADITPLSSLKHLEYLEIFHNDITDISPLKDLPYLMDLNVVRNQIADITPVMSIKSLKRLWISRYNIKQPGWPDADTLAALHAALPDCEIDAVSTSTGGTWRTHPHYDVIYRMFRTGVYEPFADSPPENQPNLIDNQPEI